MDTSFRCNAQGGILFWLRGIQQDVQDISPKVAFKKKHDDDKLYNDVQNMTGNYTYYHEFSLIEKKIIQEI